MKPVDARPVATESFILKTAVEAEGYYVIALVGAE